MVSTGTENITRRMGNQSRVFGERKEGEKDPAPLIFLPHVTSAVRASASDKLSMSYLSL